MLPWKHFEFSVSEMVFPALWGHFWVNSKVLKSCLFCSMVQWNPVNTAAMGTQTSGRINAVSDNKMTAFAMTWPLRRVVHGPQRPTLETRIHACILPWIQQNVLKRTETTGYCYNDNNIIYLTCYVHCSGYNLLCSITSHFGAKYLVTQQNFNWFFHFQRIYSRH